MEKIGNLHQFCICILARNNTFILGLSLLNINRTCTLYIYCTFYFMKIEKKCNISKGLLLSGDFFLAFVSCIAFIIQINTIKHLINLGWNQLVYLAKSEMSIAWLFFSIQKPVLTQNIFV